MTKATNIIVKFADDTAFVKLIQQGDETSTGKRQLPSKCGAKATIYT